MEYDETHNPAEDVQMQAQPVSAIEQMTDVGARESPVAGGPAIGQTRRAKPMLTVEQQIAYL